MSFLFFILGVSTLIISTTSCHNVIVARQVPCFVAKVIDQAIDGSLDAANGSIREIAPTNRLADDTADNWTSCATEQTLVDIAYFFDRRPN
ncbi:hypothetical protein [Sulfurihydrogenibium azorense]|uniref:hypothetical protein n=1 Tax=Sulfurihydrogenibium azorense TaxID=309806 RepID=UPI0039196E0A